MKIEEAKKILISNSKPEFKKYIETKLAGDFAVELAELVAKKNNGFVTLSIKDLANVCDFAGISINEENSIFFDDPEQGETELTIDQNVKVKLDDESIYQGLAAHFTEYPEEGFYTLSAEQ